MIFVLLTLIIIKHIQTVSFEYPNEYREGHMYGTTKLILESKNPYNLDYYPNYFNSYGILYPYICAKISTYFGLSLELMRGINAFFIFLIIGFIFILYKKEIQMNFIVSFILIVLMYVGLIHSANGVVRPDGLGTFFYLLSIVIPIKWRFNTKSLFFSIIFALFAFYTKPYFALGGLVIIIYLALNKKLSKLIFFTASLSISFFLSAIIINNLYPLYFYETIL